MNQEIEALKKYVVILYCIIIFQTGCDIALALLRMSK